jgi:hypothetical protein
VRVRRHKIKPGGENKMETRNYVVAQRLSENGDWYTESVVSFEQAEAVALENILNWPDSTVRILDYSGGEFTDVTDDSTKAEEWIKGKGLLDFYTQLKDRTGLDFG